MKITELLTEGKKGVKNPIKPRNFVAKNAMATTSGAGAHKDKKKAEKQGDVKHKKQTVPVDENAVVENETSYYYERLAQELFNMNPNLDTSGKADEVLNAAFPLIVRDLGSKKRANNLLNYDEDFPSDFVSAYADLKREQTMTEGGFKNKFAEFSGYGKYMQGRALGVFKKFGLDVISKDYSEDEDIQTYVVQGDRDSIEKAGRYLERNEDFGGYHLVKPNIEEEKQKGVDGKACWDGYKRMGTKKKGGKTVDNCVPTGKK
jgi:hypothetical protein